MAKEMLPSEKYQTRQELAKLEDEFRRLLIEYNADCVNEYAILTKRNTTLDTCISATNKRIGTWNDIVDNYTKVLDTAFELLCCGIEHLQRG